MVTSLSVNWRKSKGTRTVSSKFTIACIDEYNQNKLYDLNNNPIEEEEWEDDENDDGASKMGDLDINGEHQHAYAVSIFYS